MLCFLEAEMLKLSIERDQGEQGYDFLKKLLPLLYQGQEPVQDRLPGRENDRVRVRILAFLLVERSIRFLTRRAFSLSLS